jgi:hypothetical protein
VDFFAGEADIFKVRFRNVDFTIAAVAGDLSALLRRIVFVGYAPLGACLDLRCIGLRARRTSYASSVPRDDDWAPWLMPLQETRPAPTF